jgi:peptidoglycan/xylan/chitin deacetylase (PgdA/CDA1 family)
VTEQPPPPPEPPPVAPFPLALLGQDVEVLPGAGPVVALTFDAGANSAGLPKILQGLANGGVPASFFFTGSWAAANPAGVSAIVAAGHRVGNHSMTHPGFTGLPDAGIANEIQAAEQAILASGADPRPFFRFPFGERDARTIAAVNNLGYVPVRWTVDTLGWKGTSSGISAQQVADRVLAALRPGEIVLMHIGSNPDDGSTLDADALPQIIERVRAAGYSFVTLDSLL